MYEREDIFALLKMVERGNPKLGKSAGVMTVGAFSLEGWEKAFDVAAERARMGESAVITP